MSEGENKRKDIPLVPESHHQIMQQSLGMVSTVRHRDGLISTTPVTFEWDGVLLRFSTLKQRVKYKNLLANPKVTLCVIDEQDRTRYVEIRGRAEFEDDPGGAYQLSQWQKLTGQQTFDFDPPDSERVTVTIIPEQISAPLLYGGAMSQHAPEVKAGEAKAADERADG